MGRNLETLKSCSPQRQRDINPWKAYLEFVIYTFFILYCPLSFKWKYPASWQIFEQNKVINYPFFSPFFLGNSLKWPNLVGVSSSLTYLPTYRQVVQLYMCDRWIWTHSLRKVCPVYAAKLVKLQFLLQTPRRVLTRVVNTRKSYFTLVI